MGEPFKLVLGEGKVLIHVCGANEDQPVGTVKFYQLNKPRKIGPTTKLEGGEKLLGVILPARMDFMGIGDSIDAFEALEQSMGGAVGFLADAYMEENKRRRRIFAAYPDFVHTGIPEDFKEEIEEG